MNQTDVQQIFFQEIKSSLPPHLSLVETIAELINISNDSAYRRIRGEKPLSFEEIKILCAYFHISLDKLFQLNNNSFLFSGQLTDKDNFGVDLYFENLLQQLIYINTFQKREIYTIARDVFVFHYFGFHELTAFKILYWMKSIFEYPINAKDMLILESMQDNIYTMAPKLTTAFNKIPTIEIWTEDTITATLRQIDYYRQSKDFSSDYAAKVYSNMEAMIDHIENQAEAGSKFSVAEKPSTTNVPFKLFINEFIIADNSSLVVLDDTKIVYLNHTTLNLLSTRDPVFGEHIYKYFQKIMRKSTPISNTGEKERRKFFYVMRDKINHYKKQI